MGYALRRLERRDDAADALAEVMLVAWRRLDDVPAGASTTAARARCDSRQVSDL